MSIKWEPVSNGGGAREALPRQILPYILRLLGAVDIHRPAEFSPETDPTTDRIASTARSSTPASSGSAKGSAA